MLKGKIHVSEHQICNRSDIHELNSVEKINRSLILRQQHKMSAIFCINVHVLLDMGVAFAIGEWFTSLSPRPRPVESRTQTLVCFKIIGIIHLAYWWFQCGGLLV